MGDATQTNLSGCGILDVSDFVTVGRFSNANAEKAEERVHSSQQGQINRSMG